MPTNRALKLDMARCGWDVHTISMRTKRAEAGYGALRPPVALHVAGHAAMWLH